MAWAASRLHAVLWNLVVIVLFVVRRSRLGNACPLRCVLSRRRCVRSWTWISIFHLPPCLRQPPLQTAPSLAANRRSASVTLPAVQRASQRGPAPKHHTSPDPPSPRLTHPPHITDAKRARREAFWRPWRPLKFGKSRGCGSTVLIHALTSNHHIHHS